MIAADAFPERCQGLAGAVFNVFYFLGASIGLAVTDIILAHGKAPSSFSGDGQTDMSGFRASFWTLFSIAIASAFLGGFGLRKLGRIGQRST